MRDPVLAFFAGSRWIKACFYSPQTRFEWRCLKRVVRANDQGWHMNSTTWPSHFFSRPPKTTKGHSGVVGLWSWKSPCWDLVLAAWLSAASVASPSASCWTPRGWTLTVAWTGAKWPTSPSSPATTSPALRKSCHGHRAWTSSWTRSSKKSKYVESI